MEQIDNPDVYGLTDHRQPTGTDSFVVSLGGGGQCPLLLVGIEIPKIVGIEKAQEVRRRFGEARAESTLWGPNAKYETREVAKQAGRYGGHKVGGALASM